MNRTNIAFCDRNNDDDDEDNDNSDDDDDNYTDVKCKSH